MPKFMKITCKVKRIPIRELDLDHSVCIAATCSSDPIPAILTSVSDDSCWVIETWQT